MPIPEKALSEVIRKAIDAGNADLHVSLPGKIVSIKKALNLANIELMVNRPIDSAEEGVTFEKLPPLIDVPILFLQGGGASITLPLDVGDPVRVIFSDYDDSGWFATGQRGNAGQTRSHSIGYAYAIPGAATLGKALPHAVLPALVIDASLILLSKDAVDFVANATKVLTELQAMANVFASHTHTVLDPISGTLTSAPPLVSMAPASVAFTQVKAK